MIAGDDCTERLIGRLPVRVRRYVQWGECDPAQVVYTPRFTDYTVSALRWFSLVVLDEDEPGLRTLGVATPMKSMALEFHHVLRPDDPFDMTVTVGDVRVRTIDVHVDGTSPSGTRLFTARMSPIFIDRKHFTSISIPEVLRKRINRYKARCADDNIA